MRNNSQKRAEQHAFFDSKTNCLITLALIYILFSACVHMYLKTVPFEKSWYDSYALQSQNWINGKIAFDNDYDWLEMAIYKGKYYISFPPSPAVILTPFILIFGGNFSSAILCEIYALLSLFIIFLILSKSLKPIPSILLSFLFLFASPYISIFTTGAVWHHAQVLALLCILASIYFADSKKPVLSLAMLAISVGARPFNLLYIIPISMLIADKKLGFRKLITAFIVMVFIGLCYAIYNYIRFNNIFEFGHNYLPEFTENAKQFSIKHIVKNAQKFIFGLPFYFSPELKPMLREFGFSIFIAAPFISLYIVVFISDTLKNKQNLASRTNFIVFIINLLLLLSHRTMGGFQLGARYFIDCLPYSILHIIFTRTEPSKIFTSRITLFLLVLSLIFLFILNKHFVLT